jgi:hypothetical protein
MDTEHNLPVRFFYLASIDLHMCFRVRKRYWLSSHFEQYMNVIYNSLNFNVELFLMKMLNVLGCSQISNIREI